MSFNSDARDAKIKEAQNTPFDMAYDSDADVMERWGTLTPIMKVCVDGNALTSDSLSQYTIADLNKPNERGWTVLHIACQFGNKQAVTSLLEAGADVDGLSACQSTGCITPLFLALSNGFVDIANLLLERSASVNSPYDANGTSILRLAILCSQDVSGSLVQKVLAKGADASIKDYRNRCVLFGTLESPIFQNEQVIANVIKPLFKAGMIVDLETASYVRGLALPQTVKDAILSHVELSNTNEAPLEVDVLPELHSAIGDCDHEQIKQLATPANVNNVCLVSRDAFALWTGFDFAKAEAIIALAEDPSADQFYLSPLQIAGIKKDAETIQLLQSFGATDDAHGKADKGIKLSSLSKI